MSPQYIQTSTLICGEVEAIVYIFAGPAWLCPGVRLDHAVQRMGLDRQTHHTVGVTKAQRCARSPGSHRGHPGNSPSSLLGPLSAINEIGPARTTQGVAGGQCPGCGGRSAGSTGRQVRPGSIRQAARGSVLLHPSRICPSPRFLQVLDQAEERSTLCPRGGARPGPSAPPGRCQGELRVGRACVHTRVQAPWAHTGTDGYLCTPVGSLPRTASRGPPPLASGPRRRVLGSRGGPCPAGGPLPRGTRRPRTERGGRRSPTARRAPSPGQRGRRPPPAPAEEAWGGG